MKFKEKELNTTQPDVEFLTRKEASKFLRLSLSSFDKLKGLKRIKYGKSIRFSVADLKAYAEEHTIGGEKDE
jgi:hypothetical protein